MDKSTSTRIFLSKAWNGKQHLMVSPLSETTKETYLKPVLTPDLPKPLQALPGEDSLSIQSDCDFKQQI